MNITGTFDGNVNDGQSKKTGAFYYTGEHFTGSDGESHNPGGVIGLMQVGLGVVQHHPTEATPTLLDLQAKARRLM